MSVEEKITCIETRLDKIEDLIESLCDVIAVKSKCINENDHEMNSDAERTNCGDDLRKFLSSIADNLPDNQTANLHEKIEENLFKRFLLESPYDKWSDGIYDKFLNWLDDKLTDEKFNSDLIILIDKMKNHQLKSSV